MKRRYIGEKHFAPFEKDTTEHGWWTDGQREWFGPRVAGARELTKNSGGDVRWVDVERKPTKRLIDPWRNRA